MNQNIKYFNFADFDFKEEDRRVKKNKLSFYEHYNVRAGGPTIRTTPGYSELLETLLGKELYTALSEVYPHILDNFIEFKEYCYHINYEKHSMFFGLTAENRVYIIVPELHRIYPVDTEFRKRPVMFQNKNKFYIYSMYDRFVFFDRATNPIDITNLYDLNAYCEFKSKSYFSFLWDPYNIHYTDILQIDNIDETVSSYGTIECPEENGQIIKIVNFKGNLYVVQQYAISRITILGDSAYLTANNIFKAKIFDTSVDLVNDYIVFLSTAGIFIFDGNEIKSVFESLFKRINISHPFKGFTFNNFYYMIADVMFGNEEKKVLIELDVSRESMVVYFTDGLSDAYTIMTSNFYELAIVKGSGSGTKLFKLAKRTANREEKYICFNPVCFDDGNIKSICSVIVSSKGKFDLTISSEFNTMTFHVKDNFFIDNISIAGYSFKIEIVSNDNFELGSLALCVQSNLD